VSSWIEKLAGKGRRGSYGVLVQIAREVVGRRRSIQGAVTEVRHPAVLDALSDDDFRILDELITERIDSDREFAQVLARLTHAAAHAKGFDRQTVDAALLLDGLLPADDPANEREKLLRDAYKAAQRAGYVNGGRIAIARLGRHAASIGDTDRARVLLQQQVDLGPEEHDTQDEVESAILLGDILHREGDVDGALAMYQRAEASADRLDFPKGVAVGLVRQLTLVPEGTSTEQLAAVQAKALDAARRADDLDLQSRIVFDFIESLRTLGRLDAAADQLEDALDLARDLQDQEMEHRALTLLSETERELGRLEEVAERERELVQAEVRSGNTTGAAADATRYASTLLSLGRLDQAREGFERAVGLAQEAGDRAVEQRALGGLGVTLSELDQPMDALNNLMQALDIARDLEDHTHEAQWLGSIGEALWKFDQPDDATQAVQQAITAARRAKDIDLEAGMISLLGKIFIASGQRANGRECYRRALELYQQLGRPDEEIATLSALGALAMDANETASAIGLYEQALELAAEHDQIPAAIRTYGRLARLAQRQGDNTAAIDALSQAVELAETVDQPQLLGQALQHLAVALDAEDDPDTMPTYERALTLARETGDEYGEALLLTNVGARLIKQGNTRDGKAFLERAVGVARSLGAAGDRLVARASSLLRQAGAEPRSRARVSERPAGRSTSERDLTQGRRLPGDPASEQTLFASSQSPASHTP
jgi:tetratricopeptide (TPR) repeat protein